MTDLIKRLRASFEGVSLCGKCAEAADEIERLRTAGKAVCAAWQNPHLNVSHDLYEAMRELEAAMTDSQRSEEGSKS